MFDKKRKGTQLSEIIAKMNDLAPKNFKSKIQNFADSCSLRRSCSTAVISNRPTGVFNLPVIDIPPFPSHVDINHPPHSVEDEKHQKDCIVLAKRIYFVIVGSIFLGILVLCLLVACKVDILILEQFKILLK